MLIDGGLPPWALNVNRACDAASSSHHGSFHSPEFARSQLVFPKNRAYARFFGRRRRRLNPAEIIPKPSNPKLKTKPLRPLPFMKAPVRFEHLNFGSSNLFRIPSLEFRI